MLLQYILMNNNTSIIIDQYVAVLLMYIIVSWNESAVIHVLGVTCRGHDLSVTPALSLQHRAPFPPPPPNPFHLPSDPGWRAAVQEESC